MFFHTLLPCYAVTRFFHFLTTLPYYAILRYYTVLCRCVFHFVYVVTVLRYYMTTFFTKPSRYYLINLLHDSLQMLRTFLCSCVFHFVHVVHDSLRMLRMFLCSCVFHFVHVASLCSLSKLLPSRATMDPFSFPFISIVLRVLLTCYGISLLDYISHSKARGHSKPIRRSKAIGHW